MAAQIIPFPKLDAANNGMTQSTPTEATPTRRSGSSSGLHLVATSARASSQQTALRIVEDVCLEHHLPHPALDTTPQHSDAFWATLPIPPARVETPISVARRLARMILPIVELA